MMASLSQCNAFTAQRCSRLVTSQKKPTPSHRQVTFHRKNVICPSNNSDEGTIFEYNKRLLAISIASLGIIGAVNICTGALPPKVITILATLGYIGSGLFAVGRSIRVSLTTPNSSLGELMLHATVFVYVSAAGAFLLTKSLLHK